jgi:hypothetical protein
MIAMVDALIRAAPSPSLFHRRSIAMLPTLQHTRVFLLIAIACFAVSGAADAKVVTLPLPATEDFGGPIDNIYFPLTPGTTYIYEAEEEDGLVRDEFIVTHNTRVVNGVTCVEVHDIASIYVDEIQEWRILENTLDWYAQDSNGNVWYFGEDTTSFEYDDDWNLIGTTNEGAWEAGVDGALPGLIMLADPRNGRSYRQELAEDVAEDWGKVLRRNATVSVASGDFTGCLKTKEWTPLEPGVVEHKYYAPGIGLVLVNELHGGTVRVELVEIIVE